MVTISKAMSPTHSSSYFDKDDYYTEGYSQWAGAASIDLGVAGTVEKRDFYALANGFDPSTYTDEMWRQGRELDKIEQNLMSQFSKLESEESKNSFARSQEVEQYNLARQMYNEQGNKLVRDSINQNSGIQQHSRAGFDITTSAPKSVTIEAIVNNKEDVLNAHREATKETLAYIEKEFAQTRVWNQASGMQIIDHTHNLSIAQFEHSTSRAVAANTAPDPQLHTHNFVMNMTRSSDGAFRALEPSEIYKYQKLAGQIYQNQLANKMQELGYNLEWTKQKNGNYTFEIKGSEKIVGQFSKRSQSISSQVQAREQEIGRKMTQEEKQVFKNELRIAKEKQDLDQLRADWKNQINEKNLSMPLRENGSNSSNPNIDRLSDINKKAIERVEKFESVLDKHNIYLESLREGQGNYKLNDVIMDVTRNQGLEHINNKYMHTQEMRSIEAGVINKMLDSQGTMQPLANRLDAIRFIDQERTVTVDQMLAGAKGLKADQKSMINRILTSTDQYTIIQGDAGTGKTYAIEKVNEYINKARVNIEVIGLAPTGAAAQQLEEKAGIKAMTIDKFLVMHKADSPYVLQKKDVENIGISKQDLKFFSSSDSQTMYAMREFRDSTWNAIKASYERDAWRSNKGSLNDTRRYMRGGIKLTQALKTSWSTGWERRITQSGDTMYSRTTNKMNYWNKLVDGKRKTIRETIKFDKATGKSTRTLEVVEKMVIDSKCRSRVKNTKPFIKKAIRKK
jgi:conjugative relaxase domain, TrwC/TraI family